jgi:hypothetical protein
VQALGGRQVHIPPEETLQVLLEPNLIIQRSAILEIDQQVEVAPPGGFCTDYRAEHSRIACSVLAQEYHHLTPVGSDNLGDSQATPRTD